MVSSPLDIANEFIHYFTNLFTSSIPRVDYNFNFEGTITNDFTNSVLNIDECSQILKNMRINAAPGPGGFHIPFYMAAWPWIKRDVHNLITSFYTSGNLSTHLNATEIILIPKKDPC